MKTEQPRGCTGEQCKAEGTYVSKAGGKQFYQVGDLFGHCPIHNRETEWERVT